MGGLKLWSLALLGCISLSVAQWAPSGTRNVTVDELLAYGVVPPHDLHRPAPTSAPTSARCGATTGRGTECPTPAPPRKDFPSHHPKRNSSSLGRPLAADEEPLPPLTTDPPDTEEGGDGDDANNPSLSDSDFVFSTGTCMKRIRLAGASRTWRGPAVRAFFLTDSQTALPGLNTRGAPAGEAYAYFPSEGAPELGGWVRSFRAGDTRAAVAPFAAHRHFGETYKWMLYGDDDTVFFLGAVKGLLARLDPQLPIALSDNLWFSGRHPNPQAPRCLPCKTANESLPSLEKILTSPDGRVDIRASYKQRGREGLISREEYLAFSRNTSIVPGERYLPQPACPYCTREAACASVTASGSTAPCEVSTAHGGAGMIFSVGLLRSLPYRAALDCFLTFTNATGSDHMVSECLWRHGIAFTDPGGLVWHSYNYQYVVFGGSPRLPLLLGLPPGGAAASVAASGECDKLCRWMLRNAVSMHMHARLHKNVKALAAQQVQVPQARMAALIRLGRMRRDAESDGGNPESPPKYDR